MEDLNSVDRGRGFGPGSAIAASRFEKIGGAEDGDLAELGDEGGSRNFKGTAVVNEVGLPELVPTFVTNSALRDP